MSSALAGSPCEFGVREYSDNPTGIKTIFSTSPIRLPEQIRHDCVHKLRSVTLVEHLQVIFGCFLGEESITPRIVEVIISPGGHLFGRYDGDSDCRVYLGTARELLRCIHDVAPVVQFDSDQLGLLRGKVAGLKRRK